MPEGLTSVKSDLSKFQAELMNERIGMEESKKERRKDKEENKVTRKQKIEQTEVQMYEQMDY